jgi:hypothetical protein
MLVLVGDVFDHLLTFESDEASLIDLWIARLLRLCLKFDVMVRVLEGTPSHDRKQSVRFRTNQEKLEKSGLGLVKMKYVEELSIEYIEEFGIHVLYVPDEWGLTTLDTFDQVQKLLEEHQLEQVDFAFMHGMFEYQCGYNAPNMEKMTHNSFAYHAIVKHLIFIGHVHTFSRNDRIIAQGSFDRLAHGEEEAKGFVRAVVNPTGDYQIEFIENETATRFVTVACTHDDAADNLIEIDRRVRDLPVESFVRVKALKNNPILSNMTVIRERWPQFHWSNLSEDTEQKKPSDVILDHKSVYIPLQINRQNIEEIVGKRLSVRNYDPDTVQRCLNNLHEIMRV